MLKALCGAAQRSGRLVIALVTSAATPYNAADHAAVCSLVAHFGAGVLKRALLVFTHGDVLTADGAALAEYLADAPPDLQVNIAASLFGPLQCIVRGYGYFSKCLHLCSSVLCASWVESAAVEPAQVPCSWIIGIYPADSCSLCRQCCSRWTDALCCWTTGLSRQRRRRRRRRCWQPQTACCPARS